MLGIRLLFTSKARLYDPRHDSQVISSKETLIARVISDRELQGKCLREKAPYAQLRL